MAAIWEGKNHYDFTDLHWIRCFSSVTCPRALSGETLTRTRAWTQPCARDTDLKLLCTAVPGPRLDRLERGEV